MANRPDLYSRQSVFTAISFHPAIDSIFHRWVAGQIMFNAFAKSVCAVTDKSAIGPPWAHCLRPPMTAARQPDFYFSFVGDHSSPRIGGADQQQSATFVFDTGRRLDAKIGSSH
jgi:hypothetical protein